MSNPAMQGYMKVGRTTEHYRLRASQLHTTGVPEPFNVEYAVQVDRCDLLERRVHQRLAPHRKTRKREFFTVSLSAAVAEIERAVSELRLNVLDAVDPQKERARARARAEQEWREDERLARENDRKKRIEEEAKMLTEKAREPGQNALAKTERVLHIAWAAAVGTVTFLIYAVNGSIAFWALVAAFLVYFFGRLVPMLAAVLLVHRMPWGREVMALERATVEAISARRDQALKSPVVESIIAS